MTRIKGLNGEQVILWLLLLALIVSWAQSGYMCVTGQDYPPQVDTMFRPCGLFVTVIAFVGIIFIMFIMPGLHG